MDRRSFLRLVVGGVAASAAVRTWPFRVFSFPTNIVLPVPILRVGDIVHFNNVWQLNPYTHTELPFLKSFVVTENVFARGDEEKLIPVSPAILTKGPYQNCAVPANFKPTISEMTSAVMVRHLKLDDFKSMYPESALKPINV